MRSGSPARNACSIASSRSPFASNQSLARRWRIGTSSGLLGSEVRLQDAAEQVVIAVPAALVVEGDDEQVAAVERLDRRAPASPPGDGVASGPVNREDRRLQQEVAGSAPAGAAGPPRRGSRRCSGRRRRRPSMNRSRRPDPAATARRAGGPRSSPRSAPRASRRRLRSAPGPSPRDTRPPRPARTGGRSPGSRPGRLEPAGAPAGWPDRRASR